MANCAMDGKKLNRRGVNTGVCLSTFAPSVELPYKITYCASGKSVKYPIVGTKAIRLCGCGCVVGITSKV